MHHNDPKMWGNCLTISVISQSNFVLLKTGLGGGAMLASFWPLVQNMG